MKNRKNDEPSPNAGAHNADRATIAKLWSDKELERLVVVVPTETDPLDMDSIRKNPFQASIILLGTTMAIEHMDVSIDFYYEVICKLIAIGVPVIRENKLAEIKANYLASRRNAERPR